MRRGSYYLGIYIRAPVFLSYTRAYSVCRVHGVHRVYRVSGTLFPANVRPCSEQPKNRNGAKMRVGKVLAIVAVVSSVVLAVIAFILLRTEIAPPALGFTFMGLAGVLFVGGATALGIATLLGPRSPSSSAVRPIGEDETARSQEEDRVWAVMSYGELESKTPEFQKVALKRVGSKHVDFKTSSSVVPLPTPDTSASQA